MDPQPTLPVSLTTHQDNKRKEIPSHDYDPSYKKTKLSYNQLSHLEVLEMIKEIPSHLALSDEEFNVLTKEQQDGKFPLNALSGKHLELAIKTFQTASQSGKNQEQALKSTIEYLMREDKVPSHDIARSIAYWLIESNNSNVKNLEYLFTKFKARMNKLLLVTNEALFCDYLVDNKFVDMVNSSFQDLLLARDEQDVRIPFLACAPGYGKSRTLQEIFSKTKLGNEVSNNNLEILISFGNTTPLGYLGEEIGTHFQHVQNALCVRVLYSYLDVNIPIQNFINEIMECERAINLDLVLNLISEHWRRNCPCDKMLYIYLGIDEFTKLSEFTFNSETYLDGVISIIGNSVLSLKGNVRLIPFFAGLNYQTFTNSIEKSPFNCKHIIPYRFTELDEQLIVKKHFPTFYYSKELWKYIKYCNKHPRLIAWLIDNFSKSNDIRKAYDYMSNLFITTFHTNHITEEIAKWILAHVITLEKISIDMDITIEGNGRKWNVKELEENGWIYLDRKETKLTVSACFPLLKACSYRIASRIEKETFCNFLQLLENAKDFVKFNASFDCVLNRCFIYLGIDSMNLTERFRGIKFGANTNIDKKVCLESCPSRFDIKHVNFKELDTNHTLESGIMSVNELDECFFNRFMTISQKQIVLWQDWGKCDLPNFQNFELEYIVNNHFTKEKCSLIGVEKDDCIPMIITTKYGSAQILPQNFGMIDAKGLKKYYGKYVHELFSLHLPIPFPINQLSKYSEYDLAIFLGITKKRAKIIRKQIESNELINLENLKEFGVDSKLAILCKNLIELRIESENYEIQNVDPDGNCMFAASLLGYSKINPSNSLTIPLLRNKVVEALKKIENKGKLSSQIINMKIDKQFQGLGEEFAIYLKKIKINDIKDRVDEVMDKYIENMKLDKVWGGDLELKLIAEILKVSIEVVSATFISIINPDREEKIVLALDGNHYYLLVKK